jgi:hypothetical protein
MAANIDFLFVQCLASDYYLFLLWKLLLSMEDTIGSDLISGFLDSKASPLEMVYSFK